MGNSRKPPLHRPHSSNQPMKAHGPHSARKVPWSCDGVMGLTPDPEHPSGTAGLHAQHPGSLGSRQPQAGANRTLSSFQPGQKRGTVGRCSRPPPTLRPWPLWSAAADSACRPIRAAQACDPNLTAMDRAISDGDLLSLSTAHPGNAAPALCLSRSPEPSPPRRRWRG
jgi:hypothetical protein